MPKRYKATKREMPKKIWCNLNKFIRTLYVSKTTKASLDEFLTDYDFLLKERPPQVDGELGLELELLSDTPNSKKPKVLQKSTLGQYIRGDAPTLLNQQHAELIQYLFGFPPNSLTSWEYFEERYVNVHSTPWTAQALIEIYKEKKG